MAPKGKGAGVRWAPCPWGLGAHRGVLRPGEPSGCKGTSAVVAIDDDEWFCHRCGKGGGPATFARLVGDTVPEGYTPPEPTPDVDTPGVVDVEAAWRALAEHPAGWADTVRRHLVARSWPAALAERVAAHPDVIGRARLASSVPDAARRLYAAIHSGRGLWVVLRDMDGRPRDVAARWTSEGEPEGGLKGRRLSKHTRGEIAGPVVFGDVPRVVEAARAGRPVVLVEGELDYLAALAVVGDRAAVVGAPGEGSLRKVSAALAQLFGKLPDPPVVYAVPDVGDNQHKPERDPAYLTGENKMLAALTRKGGLLDRARVRWSPPVLCRSTARRIQPRFDIWQGETVIEPGKRPAVDLEDIARDAEPDAVWRVITAGLPLVDEGPHDWREVSDSELRAALHRLPLRTVLYALHHVQGEKEDDPPRYVRRVTPESRVTDMTMAWFEEHGARWFHDGSRPLVMWRGALYAVDSPEWLGELGAIGDINAATPEGRVILQKMQDTAFKRRRGALIASPFWSTAGELRIHLQHDETDTVLRIRPGRVDLVDNGTRSGDSTIVQEATLGAVDALDWQSGVSAIDGARMLFDLCGRWWTVQPADRVLLASYLLTSLVRHSLRDRPILWSIGEAGSGKTAAAEMKVGALYGERGRVLADPTIRSLNAQGKALPILFIDNAENSGPSGGRHRLERLLLNAATGKQARTRGTRTGGAESQEMQAFMAVTAIEPPTLHELVSRCLIVRHDAQAFGDPDYRPGAAGEVIRHRSALLSGIARIWAHLLERLDGVGRLASLVPTDHPIGRMRETLAVMALVGEALGTWDPRWTSSPAPDLLREWLAIQGERASAVQQMGNPIAHAMDALIRRYARVEARGGSGEMWQPAIESDELATRPVFRAWDVIAERGNPFTTNEAHAEDVNRYGIKARVVVGVHGSHAELYQDLVSTMARIGLRAEFVEAVPSASVLMHRWAHIKDQWDRSLVDEHARPRRYWFTPAQGVDHG